MIAWKRTDPHQWTPRRIGRSHVRLSVRGSLRYMTARIPVPAAILFCAVALFHGAGSMGCSATEESGTGTARPGGAPPADPRGEGTRDSNPPRPHAGEAASPGGVSAANPNGSPSRPLTPASPAKNSPDRPGGALFTDATAESGIEFRHFNGFTGEFLLPEITGSGGALFDYDNDGDLDLYLVQGAKLRAGPNPAGFEWKGTGPPRDRLYRNDLGRAGGEPRFTNVTEQAGITAAGYGMGATAGDFNNDGWIDLYVTNLGRNQMLRNNGDGTFSDVTERSGTGDPRWSTSATFFDYDNDGRLDLFVANYVEFSADLKRECYSKTSARDYCGPDSYDPAGDRIYRNQGGGVFEDVTGKLGITAAFGAGLGVIAADFDADGWTDVYVANDGDANQLWISKKGRSFEDEALLSGAALNHAGQAEASMGVDAADFDDDGDEDLFMTHLDGESNTFYVNSGKGFFDDVTIKIGLHAPSLSLTGFGTRFFDYDNDGRLDLLVLNGAVRNMEGLARKGELYPLQQRNQLFHNAGPGGYQEVTASSGEAFEMEEVSRGASLGDVDNDGDTDVVVLNNNGPARLLLNQAGNRRHWLGLRLIEGATARDVLQARIEVLEQDGLARWRRVHTDGSYCSSSDPRILFGLGKSGEPRTVRVHWPGGTAEEWPNLEVDRYWVLQKGKPPR